MGEMKVEHVLLFLVGAFLVYHMMKKIEGYESMKECKQSKDFQDGVCWCQALCLTGEL